MADKKISELNTAATVYDADDFALVQDGDTKQVNASAVKAYVKDGLSKSDVGLGNVDNTSDANKPVSAATQTALDLKQDAASAATLTGTQTLTNKTISGSSNTLSNIANSSLTNSSITINGNSVSLGGSTTVSAATTNTLTIGTGLSGTSFNGSAATTIAIDSTVVTLEGAQTLTNKTLTSPTINGGTTTFTQGTANGVLYLNGSKVATSGSALTFDGNVLSVQRSSSGDAFKWSSATGKTAYAYADGSGIGLFTGTAITGTGFYANDISSYFATYTGGIETARFTAKGLLVDYTSDSGLSGTGNAIFSGSVGIGTSSPATVARLTIARDDGILQLQRATGTAYPWNIGINSAGILNFYDITNSVERLVLNQSGNLGLGVTPSAWTTVSGRKAIEIGALGNAVYGAGAADFSMLSNAYINTSGQTTYANNGAAARYQHADGSHRWFTAPSGTANAAFTFTQVMTLTAGNNLLLGGTSDPGGSICIYMANRSSVPGTPSGGGVIYVEAGALKYKGSSGTITTLGAA